MKSQIASSDFGTLNKFGGYLINIPMIMSSLSKISTPRGASVFTDVYSLSYPKDCMDMVIIGGFNVMQFHP